MSPIEHDESSADLAVRECSLASDSEAMFALWEAALGDRWPVPRGALRARLGGGPHFMAERAGVPIGFVATHGGGSESAPTGSIAALLVLEAERGRGIGTHLLGSAVAALRARGVADVMLGGLPGPYFWPGVPTNLDLAQSFLEQRGAAFTDVRADMTLDLSHYDTPAGVMERAAEAGARFSIATPEDAAQVLVFEGTHFPAWRGSFERALSRGRHHEVLLARDDAGALVGTALVEPPDPSFAWERLLPGAGEIGVVGVAPAARSRGIGLALSARACEVARERGVRVVYLAWVWSTGWYAQLGFRIWRLYLVGRIRA